MAVGLEPAATQRDFSAGMWRGVREDLIPDNGAFDITNGLLDNDGAIYKRGGSSYRSTAATNVWVPMVWDGFLGTPSLTQQTVFATDTAFYRLNADGTTTSLAGGGLSVPNRAAAMKGVLYLPGGSTYDGSVAGSAPVAAPYYAVVANRLLAASGDTVQFSNINAPGTFTPTDIHQLPGGVLILGIEGLRDAAAVFTTDGVWVISNMSFNLTDSDGQVQHRLDHYSKDVILWGNAGIAAWEGGLVIPAKDAVWQLSLGVVSEAPQAFTRLSDPIQELYRDYVNRGFQVGQAIVYRSHYLLPILDGSSCVDLLCCRLDARGTPWTHLSGFGARVGSLMVRQDPITPRRPLLIGGTANGSTGRVLNLEFFDPTAAVSAEADGTVHPWSVQTRDMATGPLNLNTIVRLKMGYDLGDPAAFAPFISATQISGHTIAGATEWGRFDWGQADWSAVATSSVMSTVAPVDPFGYQPFAWSMAKRERFGRFRLDCTQRVSRLTLRWLEMDVRRNGRM